MKEQRGGAFGAGVRLDFTGVTGSCYACAALAKFRERPCLNWRADMTLLVAATFARRRLNP